MHNRKRKHPNALKHGAFSKIAIIPGEDPQEFKELHSALIEEWGPVGPTEEDTVLTIATGIWRKRRQQKLIQAAIPGGTLSPKHPAYDEAFALEFFSEWIEDEPDDNVAFHVLKNITADHLRQKFPRQKLETSLEWVRAMQESPRFYCHGWNIVPNRHLRCVWSDTFASLRNTIPLSSSKLPRTHVSTE